MNWYNVRSCMYRGSLIGHPVEHLRVVLTDGASHSVDSSELAFKLAAIYAFRQVIPYKMDLNCLLAIWAFLSLLIIV